MKRTRKLASLLLALVMVFALATTAFATGAVTPTTTGTITVANPVEGQTYTAYKIFDVTYDGKGNYAYTIDFDGTNNEWFVDVRLYAQLDKGLVEHVVSLDLVQGSGVACFYTTNDKFSPADFAAFLKGKLGQNPTGYTGYELTKQGDVASVSGLPLGYYFVASSTGALCNLTTTTPDVTIHDKNDMPFEKKADKTNADVGQIVNYTVTGKVPDYTGFETYIYEIADTMSQGLTFNRNSLAVKVGSADVTADASKCTITYDGTTAPNTFKVSINVKNCTVGDAITVTYTATVNEQAIAVISKNEAKLTYSNDPTDSTKTTTTPPQEQKVYTSKIVIDKVEKVAEGTVAKKLAGAEFVLYKEETAGETTSTSYYKWDNATKKVEWVADMKNATVVTTDDKGAASFDGLANGTYYLVETKAPAGYNRLEKPYKVEVEGGTAEANLTVTAKVENSAGTLLPSTGGMGTTVFYVLGAVLVLGAVVLLVTKKRMSDANR